MQHLRFLREGIIMEVHLEMGKIYSPGPILGVKIPEPRVSFN